MTNETIDKLKKAGYITVTADSQGIADQCQIGNLITSEDEYYEILMSYNPINFDDEDILSVEITEDNKLQITTHLGHTFNIGDNICVYGHSNMVLSNYFEIYKLNDIPEFIGHTDPEYPEDNIYQTSNYTCLMKSNIVANIYYTV